MLSFVASPWSSSSSGSRARSLPLPADFRRAVPLLPIDARGLGFSGTYSDSDPLLDSSNRSSSVYSSSFTGTSITAVTRRMTRCAGGGSGDGSSRDVDALGVAAAVGLLAGVFLWVGGAVLTSVLVFCLGVRVAAAADFNVGGREVLSISVRSRSEW